MRDHDHPACQQTRRNTSSRRELPKFQSITMMSWTTSGVSFILSHRLMMTTATTKTTTATTIWHERGPTAAGHVRGRCAGARVKTRDLERICRQPSQDEWVCNNTWVPPHLAAIWRTGMIPCRSADVSCRGPLPRRISRESARTWSLTMSSAVHRTLAALMAACLLVTSSTQADDKESTKPERKKQAEIAVFTLSGPITETPTPDDPLFGSIGSESLKSLIERMDK